MNANVDVNMNVNVNDGIVNVNAGQLFETAMMFDIFRDCWDV